MANAEIIMREFLCNFICKSINGDKKIVILSHKCYQKS